MGLVESVVVKEIREVVRTRYVVRLLLFAGLVGGLIPAELPRGSSLIVLTLLGGVFVPFFFGIVVTPDLFAGERERGTIVNLLMLPVSRWRLYMLKSVAGWVLAFGSFLLSVLLFLVLNVVQFHFGFADSGKVAAFVLFLAALSSVVSVAFGTLVSWMSPDVRSAQSGALIPFLVVAIGVPYLASRVLSRSALTGFVTAPYTVQVERILGLLAGSLLVTLITTRVILGRTDAV